MSPFPQLTQDPQGGGSTGSAGGRRKSPSSVHEWTGFVCVKHEPYRDCCFITASLRSALKREHYIKIFPTYYSWRKWEKEGKGEAERNTHMHTCWKHMKILKRYWKVRQIAQWPIYAMVLLFCKDNGQSFGLWTWLSILCGEKQFGAKVYIDLCRDYLSWSEVKFESARLNTCGQSPRKSNIDNPKKVGKISFTCHCLLENKHGRRGLHFQVDELIQSVGVKQSVSSRTPVNRLVLKAEMEAIHGFTKADVATTTAECSTFQQQKTWDCVIFNRDQHVDKLTDWTTFILKRPVIHVYWDWW